MTSKTSRIGTALLTPLLKELPFFVITFFLLSSRALRGIHSHLVDPAAGGNNWLSLCGETAICLLMSYLLTALVTTAGKRWLKVMLYTIILFLFGVSEFLLWNFDMKINSQALTLLMETNTREASGFLQTFLLSGGSIRTYLFVAAAIAVIIIAEKWWHRRRRELHSPTLRRVLAVALAALLVGGLCSSLCYVRIFGYENNDQLNNQERKDIVYPSDPISLLAQSFYSLHLAGKETRTALETNRHLKPSTTIESDSLTLVLVIGESFNKWHASAYGYPLNTTPHLCDEVAAGRLVMFDDAVTPMSLTSPSMKNMLCCNSFSDGEKWYESAFIPAVFKSAGYDVIFWDNQKYLLPYADFSFCINSFIFDKEITRLSYDQLNERGYMYDYPLVSNYSKTPHPDGKHQLVLFHLMGQHSPPGARYPHVKEFDVFTADSIHRNEPYLTQAKRQMIAEYDNSTLYNDHVVNAIFDLFRDRNAVVVYLSDHGEETYDYKDGIWRKYEGLDAQWLRHIHNIPFMVWCSDIYLARHPEKRSSIAEAAKRPFSIDNLCHILFHLGGVQTPYYIADRDVLSPQFRPRPRIVEGKDDFVKADYDAVMSSSKD